MVADHQGGEHQAAVRSIRSTAGIRVSDDEVDPLESSLIMLLTTLPPAPTPNTVIRGFNSRAPAQIDRCVAAYTARITSAGSWAAVWLERDLSGCAGTLSI